MPTPSPVAERDKRGTAQYIEEMARELRALAARADLGFLAYLLGMVEDDAGLAARSLPETPTDDGSERVVRLHSSSKDTR